MYIWLGDAAHIKYCTYKKEEEECIQSYSEKMSSSSQVFNSYPCIQ